MPALWSGRRYYSLDHYLRQTFGEKVYRIPLNGGMTCPNRDGRLGTRGCIFCSPMGSGDFAGNAALSVTEQLAAGKAALRQKRPVRSYIAYFQAFTNTYGPAEYLYRIFSEAAADPDVKVLSIATRPDCLGPDVMEVLRQIARQKPVWIELGLQTIHPASARYIRRGYELEVFDQAVNTLREAGIPSIAHVILFLPGETEDMMLQTLEHLNRARVSGVKLQLLHILKGTDLARDYASHPFHTPDMEEYIRVLGNCITHLSPDIVIHRLTGDGPKDLLIAPAWTGAKRTVLNRLNQYLKERDIWQGKEYYG